MGHAFDAKELMEQLSGCGEAPHQWLAESVAEVTTVVTIFRGVDIPERQKVVFPHA
jgi:hypothetical protein